MERAAANRAGMTILAIVMTGSLVPAAALADPDCTCRNRDGRKYDIGRVICLNVDGRQYLARCEMNLNVTSWTKVSDGCPLARRDLGTTMMTSWNVEIAGPILMQVGLRGKN